MESYLLDSLEAIFAAAYVRTFDNRGRSCTHCRATLRLLGKIFRATVLISGRSPSSSINALCRNIEMVTMSTSDVLLRHFRKALLYTKSIRVAYSYLLYTLAATNAVSECRASVLRRVKTYLRSTMSQLSYFLKY